MFNDMRHRIGEVTSIDWSMRTVRHIRLQMILAGWSPASVPAWPTLADACEAGFSRIWIVVLMTGRPRIPKRNNLALVAGALIRTFIPLWVALILQIIPIRSIHFGSPGPLYLIAGLSLLCFISVLASWRTWALLRTIADDADRVFESVWTDRSRCANWFLSRQARLPQLACMILGAGIGSGFLYGVNSSLKGTPEVRVASFLSVAFMCGVGLSGIYWIETGVELVWRLARISGPLRLLWHAPAYSPLILKASHIARASTTFFAPFAGMVEAFMLFIPNRAHSRAVSTLVLGFPILAVVCALSLVGLGNAALAVMVRKHKFSTLDLLTSRIGNLNELSNATAAETKQLLDIYEEVRRSPILPFNLTAYIPFVASVLTPLIAYFLTRSVH